MKSYNEILSDVTKTATKIPQSDYLDTGKYRIFDQGKEYSVGFSNDEQGVVSDYPYIIFGDHTRVVKYVNEPCFIGADGVKLLKVINKDFNPRFVYYNILAKPIENQGYARHFKFLKEIQFTEKTLSVQTNIVTELDTIQSAIDNKKQQLSLLDEAVKSRFIEMFGDPVQNPMRWENKFGKELFSFSSGKFLDASKRMEKGIPVYGGNGIAWYTDIPLISFDTIIIGRVGAYCGNIKKVQEPVWVTDNAIYIKQFKEKCFNLYFLYELMSYMNFYQYADFSGQPKITQKPLENNKYIIPPIKKQKQFATFVQQIDKSKFVVKQQIADLQELLDSKMQEYFS